MSEVVLVRHAQTECTRAGRYCGEHDPGLTEAGRRMADLLAGHPALQECDRLVGSPARRCRSTGEVVARVTGVPYTVEERFRERSFGDWDDRHPDQLDEQGCHRRWVQSATMHPPPGGESVQAVHERVRSALRESSDGARKIIVITHKTPIRLLLCDCLGRPPSTFRRLSPTISVCSVSTIAPNRRDGGPDGVVVGDVSHLPPTWRPDPDRVGDRVP